ncbi:TaqI family restriction endonuclease [Candidatus Parcubacteria bacterium]|nr:TaqI family restriction endonuclease [Candidatus Parcubacteria bacterium]
MYIEKFDKFLQTVPLKDYRKKYSSIKIVEMDLSKDIQAIELLYKVYWNEKKFISFDNFYKRYLQEKKKHLKYLK